MQQNTENQMDKKIVTIFLIIAIVFATAVCFLEYHNQNKKIYFSLEQFEKTNNEEKATVVNVSEKEDYFIVEGQVLTDVGIYKLNIGVEDENGNIGMHRTQFDSTMKQFFGRIPKEDVQGEKNIYIVYMCNNENILIKTDKVLGGDSNE